MWTTPIPWLPNWSFNKRVQVYVGICVVLAMLAIGTIFPGGN